MNNRYQKESNINDTDNSKFWIRVLIFFYEKLSYSFFAGLVIATFSVGYHRFYNDDFLIGHCICCSLLMSYCCNRRNFPYQKLHYYLIYVFVFLTSWANGTSEYSVEFVKKKRKEFSEFSNSNTPKNPWCLIMSYLILVIMIVIFGAMMGGALYYISQDIDILFWNLLEKVSQGFLSSPNPPNEVLNFIIFYGLVSVVWISFWDGFLERMKLENMKFDNSRINHR